jgi:hypothetical protein
MVFQGPDERGKRWLQTQVEQLLAARAVPLAVCAEGNLACYWGTGLETGTTLYLRLAGDPEPKALPFRRTTVARCGSGLYAAQQRALLESRRTLKKLVIVPA